MVESSIQKMHSKSTWKSLLDLISLGSIFGPFWDHFLVDFGTQNRPKRGSKIKSILGSIFGLSLAGFGPQNRPRLGQDSGANFARGGPGTSWRCCFAFLCLLAPSWASSGPIFGPSWADFGPQDGSGIRFWADLGSQDDPQIGFWANFGSQVASKSIKIYIHPYILARRTARSD